MRNIIAIVGFVVAFCFATGAAAQSRNSGDRALGTELNRERAETRIERLRQDQRQKEERAPRAQKVPGKSTTQQPR